MGARLDPPGFAPDPSGLQPGALLIELRIRCGCSHLASGGSLGFHGAEGGGVAPQESQPPEESHLDLRIQSAPSYS